LTGGVATLVTIAIVAASAPAASATVYCVTTPTPAAGCTGTAESSLADALQAASGDTAGADEIVLPSGTQTGPASGFRYSGQVPLVLSGQGTGSVITLTGGGSAPVFGDSGSEPAIALRALTVALPAGATGGAVTLKAQAGVSGVAVTGAAGSTGYGFALAGGGVLDGVSVSIPAVSTGSAPDPAVFTTSTATTTIENSFLSDRAGIEDAAAGTAIIHRCVIEATNSVAGVIASGAPVLADDSLLVVSHGASGLESYGAHASINAAQLTIVGDRTTTGVLAEGVGGKASVNLTDSIIAEPEAHSIALYGGQGSSTVRTNYDDFDRKTAVGPVTIGPHDTKPTARAPTGYLNPLFTDPSKNNYRLLASSPLLNYDPTRIGGTPLGTTESTTDLAGQARITGTRRDLGAYQHQPPTVTASASPTHADPRAAISFSATGKIVYANDPLRYSWRFDDGGRAGGQNVTHAFATGGEHTARVTVADGLGFTSTATVTVAIAGPAISHLSQSASRWRLGNALAHITRKRHRLPVGTRFTFHLNERAKVMFKFTGHRGLHRYTAHLTFFGHAGRNEVRFDGRITRRRKLKPGSYKLVITATANGQRAAPRRLHFRIV
jgi:hypothetical protein